MLALRTLAAALGFALCLGSGAVAAATVIAPMGTSHSSNLDYMTSVYDRAPGSELLQIPLATFDKEFELTPMAAESWTQSDDGLTWTFRLRPGLVWSDGAPLTAGDFAFALQRAAVSGYDFGWYWNFAGGIAGWSDVTAGTAPVASLGVAAPDDLTLIVTTTTPKPYLPAVTTLWYPVPRHLVESIGDRWATDVDAVITSGPFDIESWSSTDNTVVYTRSATYAGPWPAQLERLELEPPFSDPAQGLPAFLAGTADYSFLNAAQLPEAAAQFPQGIRRNPVFATSYLSFDLDAPPFDDPRVRRAFYYAVNREDLTTTVLRDIAMPAGSILPPGYPGYSETIVSQAVYDPDRARALLAEAGYPGGAGFPPLELWIREEGGYNAAIVPPLADYLTANLAKVLGIELTVRALSSADWAEAVRGKQNNLFLASYEYDYLDPSNFYGIFYGNGRHGYHVPEYDRLILSADAEPDWQTRIDLYARAEQVMIDQGLIVPLVHPITIAVVSDRLDGPAVRPNALGFTPLDRLAHYFFTHLAVR